MPHLFGLANVIVVFPREWEKESEHQMNVNAVRVGLVGLFCGLLGTGVAFAGDGGSTASPVAKSGDTGAVNVQSTATNTGKTGASNSSATANPVSTSGSGGTAGTGGSTHTRGQALSTQRQRPKVNGGAGGADSTAKAESNANSGAKSDGIGNSGGSGTAANTGLIGDAGAGRNAAPRAGAATTATTAAP